MPAARIWWLVKEGGDKANVYVHTGDHNKDRGSILKQHKQSGSSGSHAFDVGHVISIAAFGDEKDKGKEDLLLVSNKILQVQLHVRCS